MVNTSDAAVEPVMLTQPHSLQQEPAEPGRTRRLAAGTDGSHGAKPHSHAPKHHPAPGPPGRAPSRRVWEGLEHAEGRRVPASGG